MQYNPWLYTGSNPLHTYSEDYHYYNGEPGMWVEATSSQGHYSRQHHHHGNRKRDTGEKETKLHDKPNSYFYINSGFAGVDNYALNDRKRQGKKTPSERSKPAEPIQNGGPKRSTGHKSKEDEEQEDYGKDSGDEKQPLLYAVFVAKYPRLSFAITGLFHIAFVVVTAILFLAKYDILPIEFSSVPIDLNNDPTYTRAWSWLHRDEGGSILYKAQGADLDERTETADSLQLIYEGHPNIFTPKNLQKMAEFEDSLFHMDGYKDYCRLDGFEGNCIAPVSILRFFDGSYGPLFNDSSFSDIPGTLGRAMAVPELNAALQFHLAADSNVNATENIANSALSRTILYFGAPLPGFVGLKDFSDQFKKIQEFEAAAFNDLLLEKSDSGVGDMSFSFFSLGLYNYAVDQQVTLDLGLAVASGAFIFLFMLIQTKSLFITGFAVTSIITSFVCTNLIYRIILDYIYIGSFHVLLVFIILGIGADDIFIYNDTWRATAHKSYPSFAHRISDCYRTAALSMLVTSLTTMVAFFSIAMSPILLMSSFGIFAAFLVLVNYLSVITFFPTVVAVYHIYWEKWTWPCCRASCCPCCCKKSSGSDDNTQDQLRSRVSAAGTRRKNKVVRFLYGPYYHFVSNKIAAILITIAMLGALGFLAYNASRLAPQEEQIKLFKDDHYLQLARDKSKDFRPSSEDRVVRVYIIWGIKGQDRSQCHKTDFLDCIGDTVWDESFDLNPKPAQVALLEFCNKIRTMNASLMDELHVRRSLVTNQAEVKCFMEDFNNYITEKNYSEAGSTVNLDLPLTENKVLAVMRDRPDLYNISEVSPLYYRYFEVELSEWLHEGYRGRKGYISRTYLPLIGEVRDERDTKPVLNNSEYFYGTRLRYAAISVNLTFSPGEQAYPKGIKIVDAWENFVSEEMRTMPPSVAGGVQCTPEVNIWQWYKVQRELVENAIQGLLIGLCLSFPIITLATRNIITGILATFVIGFVTVSVIGIIPLAGWKLGAIESLNLSLVVGLAVDYVVHLAKGYHLAPHHDRKERLRYMLEHVGISILSGACSTLGASVFMLFAVVRFFMQFGIFIFCIIGFSLVYSMLLFPCVMGLIGPSGNTGSIAPLFSWIWRRFIGRRSVDVDCDKCKGRGFHSAES